MKRVRGSNKNGDEAGPSSGRSRSKRKIQACTSCRKHKTRCEILGDAVHGVMRCHRCKVLNSTCSYEGLDISLFIADSSGSDLGPSRVDSIPIVGASRATENSPISPGDPSLLPDDIPAVENMWSFMPQHLDWSYPLVAIQELCEQTVLTDIPPCPGFHDLSLASILVASEIDQLIAVYTMKFEPWSCLPLIQTGPFLDLVRCTISARYLDKDTRAHVAPRLQKLTEDTLTRMISNPAMYESLETIHGLFILSAWSPICGLSQSGICDGQVLINMAVKMAINLRINESSTLAIGLRDSTPPSTARNNALNYDMEMDKARLWIVVTNAESMFCLGSGRQPLSRRSQADRDLIPITSPDSQSQGRDLRIRLYAELLDAAEAGLSVQSTQPATFDSWYRGISSTLATMDKLARLLLPLPVVNDHDKFNYHMLHLCLLSCRQLVLYHALSHARRAVLDCEDQSPWLEQRLPVLVTWCKEALQVAENILVSVLQTDYSLLATSPDCYFTAFSFAAGLVVGCQFLVTEKASTEPLDSGEKLLELVARALSQASFSVDHIAYHTSQVIRSMLAFWQAKKSVDSTASAPTPHPLYVSQSSSRSPHESQHQPNAPLLPLPPDFENTNNGPIAEQIYHDGDLWTNFLVHGAAPTNGIIFPQPS